MGQEISLNRPKLAAGMAGSNPVLRLPASGAKTTYITNAIESLNRVIRKNTKFRDSFPTDEAATKLIYLAIRNFEKTGCHV